MSRNHIHCLTGGCTHLASGRTNLHWVVFDRTSPAACAVCCAQVDPELVDSHFLRPHDHTIRATDLPERLQLLGKPVFEVRHSSCVRHTVLRQ
jgi:hypothetical protein